MQAMGSLHRAGVSLWKWFYVTAALCLTVPFPVDSYTVEELQERCVPCTESATSFVSHPTECNEYFFCNYQYKWQLRQCAASLFYDAAARTCVDLRHREGEEKTCAYDRGINPNVDLDIYRVPQCQHLASTTTTPDDVENSTSIGGTTQHTIKNAAGGTDKSVNTTTLLAVLLAVTFLILILVIIGILLYRRRQKLRRPTNFYNRGLPQAISIKSSGPSPAANAAYLTRSLLREEAVMSTSGEQEYEIPTMSEEAGYAEVSDRTSKAYYSEPAAPMRPPMPLPGNAERDSKDDDIYSEANLPDSSADDYMHPDNYKRNSADNHLYSAATEACHTYTKPDTLDLDEPYDYCRPETANPTLSFRRDAPLPSSMSPESPSYYVDPTANLTQNNDGGVSREDGPLASPPHYVDPSAKRFGDAPLANNRPDSPPYYVDPIPEDDPPSAPHPYHTLEQLLNKPT